MALPSNSTNARRAAILVVDDHPLVRKGLGRIVRDQPDLEVCGEADGVSAAVRAYRERRADVVTADLSLQDGSGLELAHALVLLDPQVRLLICSMHDDNLFAERALRAGALGYINKHEPAERLLYAIRRVRDGQIYLCEEMAQRVLFRAVGNGSDDRESPIERLSNRELEVFDHAGRGSTTREIAQRLSLSPKTIETYRENLKAKLNLRNGTELTRHAVQWVLEND